MWEKCKYGNLIAQRGVRILDALSASGLRSIRYGKELKSPHKLHIFANDLSVKAVDTIKKNITHNKLEDTVSVRNQDATYVSYSSN